MLKKKEKFQSAAHVVEGCQRFMADAKEDKKIDGIRKSKIFSENSITMILRKNL